MRKTVEKKSGPNVFLNTGVGGLTGFLSAMLLLLIIAVLTTTGKIPESYMREVTVLSCGLGSLIGAYSSSKRQRGKTLLTGIGSGAVMFILLLLLSMLLKAGSITGELTPALLIAILIGGFLGGLLSAAPSKVKR